MAAESWWCWPLSAWLGSGTASFLFLNAIVCLVAVLSWGRAGDAALSTRRKRLTRSASSMVMERLRSVSSTIFSYQYPAADDYDSIAPPLASQLQHVQQECYYTSQEEGEMRPAVSEVEPDQAAPAPPPLVESVAVTMAPRSPLSAPVADAEVCAAVPTSGSEKEEADTREETSAPAAAAAAKGDATLERPRKWKVAGIVERRAYAEMAEKVEVNARAERFIRQFREDLKLERLNSILGCGRPAPAR